MRIDNDYARDAPNRFPAAMRLASGGLPKRGLTFDDFVMAGLATAC